MDNHNLKGNSYICVYIYICINVYVIYFLCVRFDVSLCCFQTNQEVAGGAVPGTTKVPVAADTSAGQAILYSLAGSLMT